MLRLGLFLSITLIFSLLLLTVSAAKQPNPRYGKNQRSMASQFLIAHNKIRANYNVPPLKWSKTLARYARRWANKRVNDCKLIHSPNSPYGENLFWSKKGKWGPYAVVMTWGQENKNYNPETNECINNSACGHYTQIIWKTTKRVGCGRVVCKNKQGFLYVCSYDPPGNYYYEGPLGGRFNKSIVNPPGPGASSLAAHVTFKGPGLE